MLDRFWKKKKTPQDPVDKNYYNSAFSRSEEWQAHYTKSSYYFIWTVIIDRLRQVKPKAILEIGCGPGQLALAMHEAGVAPQYMGVDFSHVALGYARKACPAHFNFKEEDAVASNIYSSVEYDVAVSTEFLEHVDGDLEVLTKIRPDTHVIATVPNFPYVSHVRHFENSYSVGRRYANLFREFSVTDIPGVATGTRFYLIEGTKI